MLNRSEEPSLYPPCDGTSGSKLLASEVISSAKRKKVVGQETDLPEKHAHSGVSMRDAQLPALTS